MTTVLLHALHDFFAAGGAEDLHRAWEGLRKALGDASSPPVQDWSEVEYAFNRLFVGPGPIPAPPYASAWLRDFDDAPRLMTDVTRNIRRLYHYLGYAVPGEGSLPDDHLAFELEALSRALDELAARGTYPLSAAPAPALPSSPAAYAALALADHLAGWTPAFCAAALAGPDAFGPIVPALRALERCMPPLARSLRARPLGKGAVRPVWAGPLPSLPADGVLSEYAS